jgi:hypothetical protein
MPVPDQVRDDGSGIQQFQHAEKSTGFRVKPGMTINSKSDRLLSFGRLSEIVIKSIALKTLRPLNYLTYLIYVICVILHTYGGQVCG